MISLEPCPVLKVCLKLHIPFSRSLLYQVDTHKADLVRRQTGELNGLASNN